MTSHDWTKDLPSLSGLDASTRERLRQLARPVTAKAGSRIFREGGPCEAYLIVLSGRVRVQKTGATGREIILYRVGAGETCVVTTAALMSGVDYDVDGFADTDIVARALPLSGFRELLASSDSFRGFVFKTFGTRISSLLARLDDVVFGRIDQRLAACLVAFGKSEILATHQDLALELGTAREVVSRHLKVFERDGLIRLGRGAVTLLKTEALRHLAEDAEPV